MPRPKSDIRISLKGRDGKPVRLNLIEKLDGRWMVMRDGKQSKKLPDATTTEIANHLRNWMVSQKQF